MPAEEVKRDSQKAERLTREAADQIDENPEAAERLLREALTSDLYFGPAHNNLGVLYLGQSKLYEAASEFEWARKLMPGHPDPRINLGIVLERGGRLDEALESYESALEVYPDYIPGVQAMARLMLRSDRSDDRLPNLLKKIGLRGESAEWREWALLRLSHEDPH